MSCCFDFNEVVCEVRMTKLNVKKIDFILKITLIDGFLDVRSIACLLLSLRKLACPE